jgi:hypothetical protein
MTRKQAIATCLDALDHARGSFREDDDGTIDDMLRDAADAAKVQPGKMLARFKAAVAKTEWAEMAPYLGT